MAHLDAAGTPQDEHQVEIRRRRVEHEIYSMKGTVMKFKIAILEAKATVERNRALIIALEADIEKREAKLAVADEPSPEP